MSTRRKALLWALVGFLLLSGGIAAALYLPRHLEAPEASAVPVVANFPAPNLHLTTLDGRKVALSDFRGHVVLVNNWATWCPPCRDEMPTLEAYYRAHAADGLVLIAIAAHEYPFEIRDFLKKNDLHLSFLLVPDPEEQAMHAFHQTHLPASYVVDANGVVRLMWVGAISGKMLERYVTPLLEK
jgi:cytochrome c biogenesis protein CcmG/thiol:disulfide interchange protein DsbE